MPVPDFQTLMRPLLEEYASNGERAISDVREALSEKFELTEEELAERLPSGLARTFNNRVGWAATYLYRVGLLVRPRRSVYAITPRGRDVLVAHPDRVDLGVLSQFPEFAEFRQRSGTRRTHRAASDVSPVTDTATPEERIEAAYQELRAALVEELRDRISAISPAAFEGSGTRCASCDGLRRRLGRLSSPYRWKWRRRDRRCYPRGSLRPRRRLCSGEEVDGKRRTTGSSGLRWKRYREPGRRRASSSQHRASQPVLGNTRAMSRRASFSSMVSGWQS